MSEPQQQRTLWTFKTKVWKKHQTFAPDVKIFGLKDQDLFFTLEKGRLIQHALKGDYILFDTAGPKQLLEIHEPFRYGWPPPELQTYVYQRKKICDHAAQDTNKYEGYLVGVPTWSETKNLGSFGKSHFPFMAPYDNSYFVY